MCYVRAEIEGRAIAIGVDFFQDRQTTGNVEYFSYFRSLIASKAP
jgi:hypothetical protein